jgi:hypothetical protein
MAADFIVLRHVHCLGLQDAADHLMHYAEEFMLDIMGINDV